LNSINSGKIPIRSTTILGVRYNRKAALGGDGQVTFGDMALKQKAVKVRKFYSDKGVILSGFAGAAADALTLFEKFEGKLEEYGGDLKRSVVELAKDWRTDKYLRHLDALLALINKQSSFIVSGDGNVIEPDGHIIAIGSGAGYAQAAAKAFMETKKMNSKTIVEKSLKIASEICIYTNNSITILETE
jgi:ATP-dependent HslUV protease subunit HslV